VKEDRYGQENHVVDGETDIKSDSYLYIVRFGTMKLIKAATRQCALNRVEKINVHVMNLGVGEIINEAPLTGCKQNFSVQVVSQQANVVTIRHSEFLKKYKRAIPAL